MKTKIGNLHNNDIQNFITWVHKKITEVIVKQFIL